MAIRKPTRQGPKLSHQRARNYFRLDYSTAKETSEGRMLMLQTMEVTRWYSERHIGDVKNKRECIKQSVARLRDLRRCFLIKS